MYTLGDRRIRIHTLCLPVTKDLSTIFSQFDVKCAISLLSKMGNDFQMQNNKLPAISLSPKLGYY